MTIEDLNIPSVETATEPIHSSDDLHQRWRALMGPLGFGERLLRFAFVGPDRCLLKVLSDMPVGLNAASTPLENLMTALRVLVADIGPGSTVALLLTRPGVGGISNADRRWAAALTAAAERYDVPIEPIFRANDEAIALISHGAEGSKTRSA